MSEIEPAQAYFLFMTRYRRELVTERQREDYALTTLHNLLIYNKTPEYIRQRLFPIVSHHQIQREARDVHA